MTLEVDDQKPEDVFVDSLIALCSTSYPQTKHIINKAFEVSSEDISKVGFSLLFQTVVREDTQYLNEDIDGDELAGEGLDEENLEEGSADEEAEENGSEESEPKHKNSEKNNKNASLGKRETQNGAPANSADKLKSKPEKQRPQSKKGAASN